MFLADELIERPWPHPRGQRLRSAQVGVVGWLKEVDGYSSLETAVLQYCTDRRLTQLFE